MYNIHIYIYIHMHICMCVCVCVYIYIYMHMYVHTPVVAHDMHRAHPLTLLVEEHLQRMHLPRRSQIVYQQLPIALRIPLRMHHCLHLT